MSNFSTNFSGMSTFENYESRSISPENPTGGKGMGAMEAEGVAAARELGLGWKCRPYIHIQPGEVYELANIDGPGKITHIWLTDNCKVNRRIILRIYWDGCEKPSVEVPLHDFFASAEYQTFGQVNSAAVCVNPARGFNSYWEMPFKKHCRMTLENIHSEQIGVYYSVDYLLGAVPENCGYLHAQFRRTNPLPYKEVYTILDGVKGKGKYVGTYLFWGQNNNGWWGEGEVKFYIDGDKEFPTICGTGTEDYFGGAYNFDVNHEYKEFSTPYLGMPKVLRPDGLYKANLRFSLYRWHLIDPIYFTEDLKVTVQALGWRSEGRYLPRQDDISSVAYWYHDGIFTDFPELPDKDYLEII
ncbi:MAG: DUF2961 domain-containing protein [Clostridia bacterium]|nr:DUF2961 domain-containing protein [Clostridia bacterium]